jgi:hypothetical protein
LYFLKFIKLDLPIPNLFLLFSFRRRFYNLVGLLSKCLGLAS